MENKERLTQELNELNEKLMKLDRFITSEEFSDVDSSKQYLLRKQAQAMQDYSDLLEERIKLIE
jgi:hypothetical protein